MQQRQLRLGDILDDYCPRERRLTNHAVVAMVGADVKQTRCTTCDAEHEYKHAKVPRQRRKGEEPAALYSQVLAGGPKRVTPERPAAPPEEASGPDSGAGPAHARLSAPAPDGLPAQGDPVNDVGPREMVEVVEIVETVEAVTIPAVALPDAGEREQGVASAKDVEDGPVHRPLIRATLPRQNGQAPPTRPAPDFTIRQPAGRVNRFRGRNQRGGPLFQGNRPIGPMGGGSGRGGSSRQNGVRPPHGPVAFRSARRHDVGRKRSK